MRAMILQCGVAIVFGCLGFLWFSPHPNPKVPFLAGLLIGFTASYLVTFLTCWLLYGYQAARTMKLDGN
jgi:hypothetical protein